MNIESQETSMNKDAILDAINSMRQEINERFDKIEERLTNIEARLTNVEGRLTNVETRLTTVEKDIEEIKSLQFSFDGRLERIEGMAYESLSIGHNLRADVKILRAEVGAWAKDVMRLEKETA